MYTGLLHLHNLLRWVILVLLIISIVRHFNGMMDKNPYSKKDRKTDLFLMIAAHTTFLIGLIQWLTGEWGLKKIQQLGMGEVMKSAPYRFFAVEHFVGMLIAVALITVGRGKGKPATAAGPEHKKAFWFFVVALVVILASVPWPFREGIGRPWFPGM